MFVTFITFLLHHALAIISARRRLQANSCVDSKVLRILRDTSDSSKHDLILGLTIGSGPNAKARCEDRGLQICGLLGSQLETTSLHCSASFNYIGPKDVTDDSVYSCLRYIYGVKADDEETIKRLASVAESDEVIIVSELDRTIRKTSCLEQTNAPWGLDFLDFHSDDSSGASTYRYNSIDGAGTVAYVIDTGLDPNHRDFEGRILGGYNFVQRNSINMDADGHGTHVAGTILGATYGVAKQAQIFALNIFGSSDTLTSSNLVIEALEFAAERIHENNEKAVINISVGGGRNSAEDNALTAVIANGVPAVVAAGNSNSDACMESPGRVPDAITVGATNQDGSWARFSNWGSCVDIAAPGAYIASALAGSITRSMTTSGTSMAAPHVTGVILQIISKIGTSDPATVRSHLISKSASNTMDNVPPNTVNRVLQSPCESSDPAPTFFPTFNPTHFPTFCPTFAPTTPTCSPTIGPTSPTHAPTHIPTQFPSSSPSVDPTGRPSTSPSGMPSIFPSFTPTMNPLTPSLNPTSVPTNSPINCELTEVCEYCRCERDHDNGLSEYTSEYATARDCWLFWASGYKYFSFRPDRNRCERYLYDEEEQCVTNRITNTYPHWKIYKVPPDACKTSQAPTNAPTRPTTEPTSSPTNMPITKIPTISPLRIKMCRYHSSTSESDCCWKDEGYYASGMYLEQEGCPSRNHIDYILVPSGVKATLWPRNWRRGTATVLLPGEYVVDTDYGRIRSLEVEEI